ncbi:MAG TPA: GntR family transcriptional regulator [Planctomycetota bacterium]|nr:GntR family transcriptional regulator [Planctomycetota bacterium]
MLHIQIDPHSGIPVYRQVMDQVKYYAASGALKVGAQLPSIRELSKTLSVNPTTVVKAYTELQHEGVIEMKQGKGAFVAEVGRGMSEAERRKVLERLTRQMVVEAKQMGAPADVVRRVVEEQLEEMGLSREGESGGVTHD